MNNEKERTEGISIKQNKFLEWLDNYWYHYKWVTIIATFAFIVFSVCIIQSCSKEPTDILVTYIGSKYFEAGESTPVQNALGDALPDDFSKGKGTSLALKTYYALTKNQIERIEKQTDSDGYQKYIDKSFNSQEIDSFESQLMTGSGSVIFIDPELFDEYFGEEAYSERLQPLTEVLGELPAHAENEFAVRLGDTEIYKNSSALKSLPADTLICLHKKIITQKDYDKEVDAFKVFTKIASGIKG